MDADDVLLPHRFETQLEALRRRPAPTCAARPCGSSTTTRTGRPAAHEPAHSRGDRPADAVQQPDQPPDRVYRRALALEVGGYPAMRFMQDYDLFARMLAGGARMTNLDEPLVLFRAAPDAPSPLGPGLPRARARAAAPAAFLRLVGPVRWPATSRCARPSGCCPSGPIRPHVRPAA